MNNIVHGVVVLLGIAKDTAFDTFSASNVLVVFLA